VHHGDRREQDGKGHHLSDRGPIQERQEAIHRHQHRHDAGKRHQQLGRHDLQQHDAALTHLGDLQLRSREKRDQRNGEFADRRELCHHRHGNEVEGGGPDHEPGHEIADDLRQADARGELTGAVRAKHEEPESHQHQCRRRALTERQHGLHQQVQQHEHDDPSHQPPGRLVG
jgi:hypothetical protein